MQCIRCETDSKYKDRKTGAYCRGCGEKFAFEPKTDRWSVSDGMFKRVIDDISSKGTLYFTEKQIYYEFNRRLRKRMSGGVAGGIAIGAVSTIGSVVFAVANMSFFPLVFGVCGVGAGVAYVIESRKRASSRLAAISFPTFTSGYLTRWIEAHGEIDKLLKAAAIGPKDPRSSASMPTDLSAYSFDRALVTGSREIAAMLVANRFHFENNCAILSYDGYPDHVFDTVMSMLRRNPNLTVYTVHNASYAGMRLAGHMRDDTWFPDRAVRIVDLGLRPQHAIKLKLIALQEASGASDTSTTAARTPEETKWLADGFFVDLAALRPAQLMRAIYQGFARANRDLQTATMGDDGILIYSDPGGPWVSDPGADVYASDSFG